MIYCPLMSYAKQYSTTVSCLEEKCGFSDAAGECLVKQALQCYIAKERAYLATETYTPPSISDIASALIKHTDGAWWERKE